MPPGGGVYITVYGGKTEAEGKARTVAFRCGCNLVPGILEGILCPTCAAKDQKARDIWTNTNIEINALIRELVRMAEIAPELPQSKEQKKRARWGTHSFRKGAIRAMLQTGMDIQEAQTLVGWKAVESAEHYAETATVCHDRYRLKNWPLKRAKTLGKETLLSP